MTEHCCLKVGSNVVIFFSHKKSQISSTTYLCKMMSILVDTLNGFTSE